MIENGSKSHKIINIRINKNREIKKTKRTHREAVHSSSIKPFQYGRKRKEVMNRVHSFSQLQDIEKFKVHSHNLDHLHKKRGLLSLLLFPEKTVIKKRDIITWWMGLGDILGEGM